MVSHIQELSPSVRSKLRSGIAITSVAQCIEELVLNSIDSGAANIAVRVDLDILRIQVVDNGHGITESDMKVIGKRYATSKCYSLVDLKTNLTKHGYRGEALASIIQISGIVDITSRYKKSNITYSKLFTYGKNKNISKCDSSRPSCGTTVTIQDFMYNMPVRRKLIKESVDIENIKTQIERITLISPDISITFRNDKNKNMILELKKTRSILGMFLQMFGNEHEKNMAEIYHSHDQFEINGYISTQPHQSKCLQFIYINKRFVRHTRIHSLMNDLLSRSSIIRSRTLPNSVSGPVKVPTSPPKGLKYYGIYVLNIVCPHNEYDVCLEPKKTLVEFKNWDKLLACVEEMVLKFIKEENLTISLDERFRKSEKEVSYLDFETPIPHSSQRILQMFSNTKLKGSCEEVSKLSNERKIEINDVKAAIHSLPARRKSSIKDLHTNKSDNNGLEQILNSSVTETEIALKEKCKKNSSSLKDLKEKISLDENHITSEEVMRNHRKLNEVDSNFSSTKRSSIDDLKRIHIANENSATIQKAVTYNNNNNGEKSSISSIQALKQINANHRVLKSPQDFYETPRNKVIPSVSPPTSHIYKNNESNETLDIYTNKRKHEIPEKKSKTSLKMNKSVSHSLGKQYKEISKKKEILKSLHNFKYEKTSSNKNKNTAAKNNLNVVKGPSHVPNLDTNVSLNNKSNLMDESFHFDPIIMSENIEKSHSKTEGRNILEDINIEDLINDSPLNDVPLVGNHLNLMPNSNSDLNLNVISSQPESNLRNKSIFSLPQNSNIDCHGDFKCQKDSLKKGNYFEVNTSNTCILSSKEPPISNIHNSLLNFHTSSALAPDIQLYNPTPDLNKNQSENIYTSNLQSNNFETVSCCSEELNIIRPSMSNLTYNTQPFTANEIYSHPRITGKFDLDSAVSNVFSNNILPCSINNESGEKNEVPIHDIQSSKNGLYIEQNLNRSNNNNDQETLNGGDNNTVVNSSFNNQENIHNLNSEGENKGNQNSGVQNLSIQPLSKTLDIDLNIKDKELSSIETLPSQFEKEMPELFSEFNNVSSQTSRQIITESIKKYSEMSQVHFEGKIIHINPITGMKEGENYQESEYSQEKAILNRDKAQIKSLSLSESNNCSSISGNDWKKVPNKSRKDKDVYINLRTGNSSFVPPPEDPCPQWKSSQAMGSCPLKVPITDETDPLGLSKYSESNQAFTLSHGFRAFMPSKRKYPSNTVPDSKVQKIDISDLECSTSNNGNMQNSCIEMSAENGEVALGKGIECLEETNNSNIQSVMKAPDCLENKLSEKTYEALNTFLKKNSLVENEFSKWNDREDINSCNQRETTNLFRIQEYWETTPDFAMDEEILTSNLEMSNQVDGHYSIKSYNIVHPYKFTKNMLKESKVFGQVDEKFIAILLPYQNTNLPLIVLVDQHAADERVRLEKVIQESYEIKSFGEGKSKKVLKSERINPPIEITFKKDQVRIMKNFRDGFLDVGLEFTQINETAVLFHCLPCCLVARDPSEKYTRRCQIASMIVEATVAEMCENIKTLGGTVYLEEETGARPLPKPLTHVLNTIACRSAIKFGDKLSSAECNSLIESLSDCKLPFQCAHGRPSLVPICDLNYLRPRKKQPKPNLKQILQFSSNKT